jgi:antitoxin MazE
MARTTTLDFLPDRFIIDKRNKQCISSSLPEGMMQVAKWGNSLAVRLPSSVVKALDLKEGDDISIQIANERAFEIVKTPTRPELIARLRALRGTIPSDFKFDRIEANER